MKVLLKILGVLWAIVFCLVTIVLAIEGEAIGTIVCGILTIIGIAPLFAFRSGKKRKQIRNVAMAELSSKGFIVSKQHLSREIELLVDDTNKKFAIIKNVNYKIYNYFDLLDFELNEDGNSIAKGKGLATAVGGLTFGVVGAMVGASGQRKSEDTCYSMIIRLMVNDLHEPQIVFSIIDGIEVKKSSYCYIENKKYAKEVISTLTYIQSSINNVGASELNG